jgi:serralysin
MWRRGVAAARHDQVFSPTDETARERPWLRPTVVILAHQSESAVGSGVTFGGPRISQKLSNKNNATGASSMTQPTALEQYLLELINAERAKVGAQPLAFDGDLNESAEGHSAWMIGTDVFSHTGSGGSTATQRMTAAGYALTGSWATGENIAWATTRSPAGLQDEVSLLHTNLMNSSGHRANILNANFREVGLGFEVGDYQGREAAFITENFARAGTGSFLTGVAFDDKDGDKLYDPGEGLGALKVTAIGAAGTFTTTTMDAGGYDLQLPAGAYKITFSGAGIADWARDVTIGSQNVKLDLVDPAAAGGTQAPVAGSPEPPPPTTTTIAGNNSSNTLTGTAGADVIQGLGGRDTLYGQGGNDRVEGGSGNDSLYGGAGLDQLLGGSGYDSFVFNTALDPVANVDQILDFSTIYDTIRLDDALFTALAGTGTLSSAAFHTGVAAHDSTDRIIYDRGTGALTYDADGTGAAAAIKFAQLSSGLALASSDFAII